MRIPPVPTGASATFEATSGDGMIAATAAGPVDVPEGVLAPTDLTYVGSFGLGSGDIYSLDTSLYASYGAMALRYVGGQTRLFVTGKPQSAGGFDDLHEFTVPATFNGPSTSRATLVRRWGDPLSGTRLTQGAGDQIDAFGLHWDADDPEGAALWVGYGATYTAQHNPCWTKVRLNDGAGTMTRYGPYRTRFSSQSTKGYATNLSARITAALGDSRYRFATGCGPTANLGPYGWGAFLEAHKCVADGTAADALTTGETVGGPALIYHADGASRMSRPDTFVRCDWDYGTTFNASGHQPRASPIQDGSGCTIDGDLCGVTIYAPEWAPGKWNDIDAIGGCCYIEGAEKRGFVFVGQLVAPVSSGGHGPYADWGTNGSTSVGKAHNWYGVPNIPDSTGRPYCAHGYLDDTYNVSGSPGPCASDMVNCLWIYDEEDVYAVATGAMDAEDITPVVDAYDMSLLAHSGTAFPQRAPKYNAWRSVYDSVNQRLFVLEHSAETFGLPYYLQPIVHVFSVDC